MQRIVRTRFETAHYRPARNKLQLSLQARQRRRAAPRAEGGDPVEPTATPSNATGRSEPLAWNPAGNYASPEIEGYFPDDAEAGRQ